MNNKVERLVEDLRNPDDKIRFMAVEEIDPIYLRFMIKDKSEKIRMEVCRRVSPDMLPLFLDDESYHVQVYAESLIIARLRQGEAKLVKVRKLRGAE